MAKETVGLDDMMDRNPRTRSTAPIDLTKGVVNRPKSNEEETNVRVSAVQSGPIDMDTAAPIDVSKILPHKEKKGNPLEDQLMADLDRAVDRECESITERIEAVRTAQEEELMNAEEAAENEELEKFDSDAVSEDVNDDYTNFFDDDEDEEYYGVTETVRTGVAPVATKQNNGLEVTREEVLTEGPTTATNIEKDGTDDAIIKPSVSTKNNIIDGVNDDDLFDDEDEAIDDTTEDTDSMINDLKKEIKERTGIKKSFDLSTFTISKKSISAQKVMKLAVQKKVNVADWALYSAKRPISMTGLSGPEILKLNPETSNRNRLNTFRDMYRIIYEHIYDANKPEFETWLKQTKFIDLQHIYFALYMATFGGSNFVNYSCPHCKKVFIKDITFESMVEYADDAAKERVKEILKMDTTTADSENYKVDLVQISDNYVFALRSPSIWNVIIETASLSDKFIEKHADLIDVVSYIDGVYIIDEEHSTLIPVDTKPVENDQAKTSARRIKAFYDVISSLSSEDYYNLRSKIGTYDEDVQKVTYIIPATTCPECATEIPANKEMSPDAFLFTRHQLAAIGNM